MDPEPLKARPIGEGERIKSLDVLRGFALLGILAMNIRSFAGPFSTYLNPRVFFDYSGLNRVAYWFTGIVFDTKMMSLFSALFGAGMLVFASKSTRTGRPPTALWFRRCAWLLLIGLVHAYLIWEGDILVPYATCGLLFLWWIRRFPACALALIAIAMISFGGLISLGHAIGFESGTPEQQAKELAFWQPSPQKLREEIAIYRDGYPGIVRHRVGFVYEGQTIFFLAFFLWRAGGMMVLGAALFKWGILTGARSVRFYLTLAIAGYAIGLPIVFKGLWELDRIEYRMPDRIVPDLFNYFGSVAVALAHASTLLLLLKRGVAGRLLRAFGAVGRMAFTNYLMQSVLCTTIFYGYGLRLFARLDYAEQLLIVAALWALSLALSPWWLARYHFGPAEWLWRTLTYWRLQPFRRTRTFS